MGSAVRVIYERQQTQKERRRRRRRDNDEEVESAGQIAGLIRPIAGTEAEDGRGTYRVGVHGEGGHSSGERVGVDDGLGGVRVGGEPSMGEAT